MLLEKLLLSHKNFLCLHRMSENVLQKSEMCVCDLAEILGVTQSAVSHQLRMLKQMKLVKNRRDGKTVYYSLADGHIQSIISQGMEHITE